MNKRSLSSMDQMYVRGAERAQKKRMRNAYRKSTHKNYEIIYFYVRSFISVGA